MENLIYAAEILLPIVILILFGYLLRRLNLFTEEFLKVANNIVFKVFFPIMVFYNIFSKDDIIENLNYKLIAYVFGIVTVIFILLMLIVPRFIKENSRKGVMVQGMFMSNFLLFGIPLVGKSNLLAISIIAGLYIPFINIFVTIAIYSYSEDSNKNFKKVILSCLTNPLFIGGVLGIIFGILRNKINFTTPYVIDKPVTEIVALSTPFAFMLLGGGLKFKNLFKNIKYSAIGTFIKVVILPLVIIPLAVLIGFDKIEYAIIIAIASTPNAVTSYTLARVYKADYELAGEMVILSTITSIITIFIILTISMSLGLINPPI